MVGMKKLGFKLKLFRLVKATLLGARCRVKVQNECSEAFDILGDCDKEVLGFTDDSNLASSRHSGVEDTFTGLKVEAEKMGLVINETKTKYMKTNSATIEQQDGDVITIGGQRFEVVDEFVYLGALIRADSDNSAEIKRRIMSANRCFFGL